MTKDKHLQFITTDQVNAAFKYLAEQKKHRKTNEFVCLGRDSKTRVFLRQVKMPALPLLADNKELRDSLKPREKSPLFRVVAGAISLKASYLQKQIALVSKQERENSSVEILYRLESPKNGEYIDKNPLTGEQFDALINP